MLNREKDQLKLGVHKMITAYIKEYCQIQIQYRKWMMKSQTLTCTTVLIEGLFFKSLKLSEMCHPCSWQGKTRRTEDTPNDHSKHCFPKLSKRATNATAKEVENGSMKVPNQQGLMQSEPEQKAAEPQEIHRDNQVNLCSGLTYLECQWRQMKPHSF